MNIKKKFPTDALREDAIDLEVFLNKEDGEFYYLDRFRKKVKFIPESSSSFEDLTDTPSYAGNALKLLRVNALENAVEATDSLYENVFEFTLNDTQIQNNLDGSFRLFDNTFLDKAIEYKLTLIFKRNGSTGTYGGLNLNGLAVRTSISYPTIGENVVNLINEAFIADPLDGLVVLYGNSSSLASGYEFVTPYPLGASLSLTTGNFSNPTPVGNTANCTLYTKLEYNIIG